ncbi:hypothetical protein D1B33_17590 [Lysinibacillus yapensis]|uniref:Uncharacterized protein n=1 Tax=Ureibacillus yapensis TaxID=2304605 RepID=A0A396S2U9_9BACL|nr:hypothetical protein [Lysinibacillus yapensis]RHW31773.1 hypothetical protein D1B33_17590 [Lysinibacillus yapensis]
MHNKKKIDQLIHLPDLRFVRYCEENFGVNRGIYNIIDAWFYDQDMVNVSNRRKVIIEFFSYLNKEKENFKFGPGGVKAQLENFWISKKDSQVVSA